MIGRVSRVLESTTLRALICALWMAGGTAGLASAQTTLNLSAEDATLRGGSYANTNFSGNLLVTRASDSQEYERRALLKFETHLTIPARSTINSAALTLTVRGGNASTRRIGAFFVTEPFTDTEATWNRRRNGLAWARAGGSIERQYAVAQTTNQAGSKVTFDLRALLQKVVNEDFGSRYLRVLLIDLDPAARDSYREYHSSRASNAAVRPVLTVAYGGSGGTKPVPTDPEPAPEGGTTLSLRAEDATLRGGRYANTNFSGNLLVTRASADPEYVRRALLKFETHLTIPARSTINSAALTLTVRGGNAQTRRVGAFFVTEPFTDTEATWTHRRTGLRWAKAGGTTERQYAVAQVSNVAGSRATFDLTALLQKVVNEEFGSRYLRVLLIDLDPAARDSYKEYHSSRATNTAVRPVLQVVYGGAGAPVPIEPAPPPPPSPVEPSSLRVLTWNIQKCRRTDYVVDCNRIADWIRQTQADVALLSAVHTEDHAKAIRARLGGTWGVYYARAGTEGQAILSRYPLSGRMTRTVAISGYESQVILKGTVTVNGRAVNFFAIDQDHRSASVRYQQAVAFSDWASGFPEPRIVGGDFNEQTGTGMTYWLSTRRYDNGWDAASSRTGYSGNTTGRTRRSRLDHILRSKGAAGVRLGQARVWDARDFGTSCGSVQALLCRSGECTSGCNSPYVDDRNVRPSDHIPLTVVFHLEN
jgi:endonuclease/exonuclease/phosphatase family metal-dependent hydrolase